MTALDVILEWMYREHLPRPVAEAYEVLVKAERLELQHFGLGSCLVPKADGPLLKLDSV